MGYPHKGVGLCTIHLKLGENAPKGPVFGPKSPKTLHFEAKIPYFWVKMGQFTVFSSKFNKIRKNSYKKYSTLNPTNMMLVVIKLPYLKSTKFYKPFQKTNNGINGPRYWP